MHPDDAYNGIGNNISDITDANADINDGLVIGEALSLTINPDEAEVLDESLEYIQDQGYYTHEPHIVWSLRRRLQQLLVKEYQHG